MTNPPLPSQATLLPPAPGAPLAQTFRVQPPNGAPIHYAYQWPHASVTATVVLHDPSRHAVLLIRRATPPFLGQYAFPGGFLEVNLETTEQTAARELKEETGVEIPPAQFRLLDVCSAPHRDPRDHVIDISYYVQAPGAAAQALDEIDAIRWATPNEIDTLELAFDHLRLWRKALEIIG